MSRVIVITSGKGGVGKTTLSANLSMFLASLGKRVVAVEGDVGLNNLDVAFGVEDRIIYDAGEVALGKATVSQALVKIRDNLYLFPSTTTAHNVVTVDIFLDVIKELSQSFEYVIIDSPAGIEDNFHRACVGATEGIIVTTPHISAVRDASKTVKMLRSYGINEINLVVNRVRGELVADKLMLSPDDISKALNLPIVGILPEDDFINLYSVTDVKNKRIEISYAYSLLANYIDKRDKKLYDCVSSYGGFFGKVRRFLDL